MMTEKILLLTPFMSYKDRWGQYYKGAGDTFPQGIGSIAAYLEERSISVDVIEPDIEGMDLDRFRDYLLRGNYDLVGVSAFTPNIVFAYETAKIIKATCPDTKVVIGGAHPTLFPQRTLEECNAIDFAITHEGEKPLLHLIQSLQQGTPLSRVPNLYYRINDRIIQSTETCSWLDLDELPIYPYHKFAVENYVPAPSLRKVLPTFNYMAQRGCPYNCSFCDTRTHGKKVRYRSVERVINDISLLQKNHGIKGLIFEGSNFTINTKWIQDLCRRMLECRMNLTWYCMGRVDLDLPLLPLMKEAGLWCMSFGIESANDKTLKRMNKQISVRQVVATIKRLKELKIRSVGSFILGYPGENTDDVMKTIQYACDLELDVAVFFVPVPFPGTELHDDALASGGLKENITWTDYQAWLDHNNPIYVNPLLGEAQHALYNYAFRKFYLRPHYIYKQLRNIRSFSDISRLVQGFQSVQGLIRKYFLKST